MAHSGSRRDWRGSLVVTTAPTSGSSGYRARRDVHTVFLPPEAVLLDERTGDIHRFNASASAVWMLLDGQESTAEIAEELAEIFGATPEDLVSDIEAAIADFSECHLLDEAAVDLDRLDLEPESSTSLEVLPRPPDPGGGGFRPPVWAGMVTLRVGAYLVGVEFDGEDTRTAIEHACARWLDRTRNVNKASFGIRETKVGSHRQAVVALHYGSPVREYFPGLDPAVEALVRILEDLERPDQDGQVRVDARLLVSDGSALLAEIPSSVGLDHRQLRAHGIEEVHVWKPRLDLETNSVEVGDMNVPLAGYVVCGQTFLDLDEARRHVWDQGMYGGLAWAWLVDWLADSLWWSKDVSVKEFERCLHAR